MTDFSAFAMARFDTEYVTPPPSDFKFGLAQASTFLQTYDRVIWQWRAWTEHGKTPSAGGLNDQPPEWEHDMRLADRIFNTVAYDVRQEIKDRKP